MTDTMNHRIYGTLYVHPQNTAWLRIHERASIDDLGFTLDWLDPTNPEPARVQFDTNYKHGGGYRPFGTGQWELSDDLSLQYPGDPAYKPLWLCKFRDHEHIVVYPHAWFMILDPATKEFVVARMD